jgi:thiol-disulfide isomerase/thioredoxin
MTSTRAPRPRSAAVAKAQRAGDGSKKVWIIAAAVLVVALAGVMAFALAGEETASDVRANQTADVEISGDPIPQLAEGQRSAQISEPAPEVSGTALGGGSMSIENDGTPKVISFMTHWCPNCQAEVPIVAEWWNAGNAPDDVDFLNVNTGVNPARPNYPPTEWYEREDWEVPTLLDDAAGSVANAFGLSAYPFWVVIDGDGNVIYQQSGQIGVAELEGLIDIARNGA